MEPEAKDGLERKLNARLLEQSKAELESNGRQRARASDLSPGRLLQANAVG